LRFLLSLLVMIVLMSWSGFAWAAGMEELAAAAKKEGSSFTKDVGKVVGMAASGVPPEWDLMVIHDAGHVTLWLRKLHLPYDYKGLGIDPKAIHYDSGPVSFARADSAPGISRPVP
jgi:hypothetical protein